MSQTAYRTHHATEVTEALVGQKVTLAGWVDRRRDHGGVAFIDLRDSTGLVQVVIYDEDMARPLRSEFVIQITGEVRLRPDGNENTHLATGKIEVVAETIEILAKSDALPFQVSTALENESENKLPGEDVRLKYRYLDLRRPSMQYNLKLRSDMAKQSIKKTLSTQIDLANRVQKFVDCRTKDASRRELYIVEGDSAMGAVKSSRDSEYQAIMPIRGKILNCLKADYARIFKSDVIVDLIKVMGCGVELGGKHNKELATFNLDNLRFNKIVICTDADVDGYQIRTLVLTMLYRLTPTLIEKGYVYIAESPLYEITTKDRTYFAYTEPEKTAFLEEIGEKKYTIQRSKGLGENDPEMMWLTTMNPESRRLIKVMPTDVVQTAQVFDILLGDNLAGRKEHIAQHGAEYLDDLDVS